MSKEYTIKETQDYDLICDLMKNSGLGVEISTHNHDGIVKMWRMDDLQGNLIGAVIFHFRGGVYTLGGLAVKSEYKGHGYGGVLLEVLYNEARSRGLTELWTCGKILEYYEKYGWVRQPWDESPRVATHCPKCAKFHETCFPWVMKRTL